MREIQEERDARRGSAALNKAYQDSVESKRSSERAKLLEVSEGLVELSRLSDNPVIRVRLEGVARNIIRNFDAKITTYEQALDMAKKASKVAARRASAQAAQISGQGDYKLKDYTRAIMEGIGGGLGGMTGLSLGGPVGGAIGASTGSTLGGDIARMVGLGDYTVGMNTLVKKGYTVPPGMPVPQFGSNKGSTTITHREYVGDVVATGSSSFSVTSFVINPGNSLLFPWLSVIAQNYSQYEFKGLVAQFVSTTSDITAGGGLGTVILGTNYDVLQNNYANKQVMENSQYSVSARPSVSMIHTFECDPKLRPMKTMFIRDTSSNLSAPQDARFSDLGKFQVAQVGMPGSFTAGTVLGELWLSYEVVLSKADIADPSVSGSARGDAFLFGAANRATQSDSAIFGTGAYPTTTGTLGGTVGSFNTYAFPPNVIGIKYFIYATWLGTPVAANTVLTPIGFGCTVSNVISFPQIAGGDSSDRVGVTCTALVTSNAANVAFLLSGVLLPTAITQTILYVFPVQPTIPFF